MTRSSRRAHRRRDANPAAAPARAAPTPQRAHMRRGAPHPPRLQRVTPARRGSEARCGAGAQILLLAALVSFGISYAEEAEGADALSKFIEPGVIVLILVLNATVGVWMARALRRGCSARPQRRASGDAGCSWPFSRALARPQESNAESALDALKELQSEHAKTLRDGKMVRCRRDLSRFAAPRALRSPAPLWPQISELPARDLVPGDVVELRVGDKVRWLRGCGAKKAYASSAQP
jgi:hypothetical protein